MKLKDARFATKRFWMIFICLLLLETIEPIPMEASENWVHWRGPSADGHAGIHAVPPRQWDKSKNIAWTVDLPGEGSATPIVFGNQIFILSAVKTERKSDIAIVND